MYLNVILPDFSSAILNSNGTVYELLGRAHETSDCLTPHRGHSTRGCGAQKYVLY